MRSTRRLTHRFRELLPAPVAALFRRGVTIWGTATARWRMTPDFIIVGAQRSGTTTLFRMLSDHPQVVRPTVNKGVAYFDLNYGRGWSWYQGHFPLLWFARLTRRTARPVTFESSGYYLVHPLAASRIAADLPGVKIVAMVRDPVDRAHSAHRHEQRRGFESEEFERALELEASRTDGEAERILADPTYASFSLQHHAYVGRGEYAAQIQRYVDAVGRDRVRLVDADLFFEDPGREFGELCSWLGLEEPENVDGSAWNAASRAPLDPAVRARLASHFEPHDRALEGLLGRPPSWRSAQVPADEQVDDAS